MKVSLWYLIIHLWGIFLTEDSIDIWTPLFIFRMGWMKDPYFDYYVQKVELGFIIFQWPIYEYDQLWKVVYEKIYDRISLRDYRQANVPRYYLEKKYEHFLTN